MAPLLVKEYMTAVERAPVLKATGLDKEFKLLAEFSGAGLAGRETKYGYMFVTWRRDYEGTGVIGGGYYLDVYEAAKLDFAVRAGLVKDQVPFPTISSCASIKASTIPWTPAAN